MAIPVYSQEEEGQYDPEVNALLAGFLNCWDRAMSYSGPQYMPANEKFVCKALMDNSHAALNHIYNAGTLETYSTETQDLAYEAANIIVQYVTPGVPTSPGVPPTMDTGMSDSFFEALGSGSTSSGYLTGGMYGDVCNYTLGMCQVTDDQTGTVSDVPWTVIANEDIEIID